MWKAKPEPRRDIQEPKVVLRAGELERLLMERSRGEWQGKPRA